MEFQGRFTCLHRSDRHVLHTYESGFYEYSPESISVKSPKDANNSTDKNNTPVYTPKDKINPK